MLAVPWGCISEYSCSAACSCTGPCLPPDLRGAEPTQRFLCEPHWGRSRKKGASCTLTLQARLLGTSRTLGLPPPPPPRALSSSLLSFPRLLRSPSASCSCRGLHPAGLGASSCGETAGAGPRGAPPLPPPTVWGRARPLPPRPRAWSQVQTASPSAAAAERDAAGGQAVGAPRCLRGSMVSGLGLGGDGPEPP